MGLGAVKIYDKTMKLIKKISPEEVSKTFWDNKFRKKDLKWNKQLKSPERDDRLYKKIRTEIIDTNIKKKKVRDDASKIKQYNTRRTS